MTEDVNQAERRAYLNFRAYLGLRLEALANRVLNTPDEHKLQSLVDGMREQGFAPLLLESSSGEMVWGEIDARIIDEFNRTLFFPETRNLATAAQPALAKASIARRPPVQLVVLVLLWLILLVGPVAAERLPSEIQAMLSTEVGTVALGLTITQMMNDQRK